eukprot:TRINITY_DN6158_c0_g1_i1.p1 TRINITY_DN6158_c0_g1~~TRINITY_DN6158_c0_g1_i1.p1  ORF type:complete len:116 (-),score=40.15 TRINITY_DN6158_c0_g1_i1:244-564(-)
MTSRPRKATVDNITLKKDKKATTFKANTISIRSPEKERVMSNVTSSPQSPATASPTPEFAQFQAKPRPRLSLDLFSLLSSPHSMNSMTPVFTDDSFISSTNTFSFK